jgi:arylsulfatase A-like enzyme
VEHQRLVHGNSLFLPVLHVPLLVVQPGRVPAGRRVDRPVALYDLPATIVELTGLTGTGFPGRSLVPLWGDSGALAVEPVVTSVNYSPLLRKVNAVSRGDIRAVEDPDWRYIRQRDEEQLYLWSQDPGEDRNLAATSGAELGRLRTSLDSALARWPRQPGPTGP